MGRQGEHSHTPPQGGPPCTHDTQQRRKAQAGYWLCIPATQRVATDTTHVYSTHRAGPTNTASTYRRIEQHKRRSFARDVLIERVRGKLHNLAAVSVRVRVCVCAAARCGGAMEARRR